MNESTQHKLDRVRKPKVHITYDVEIGDAIKKKEIPFVVGVLADLSGNPEAPLPKLKKRKFIEIDRDNFNSVMAGMQPRLKFSVEDKLTGDPDKKLSVELKPRSIDDFHPEKVAEAVPPLAQSLETRRRLSELLNKLDGNDELGELLQDVIGNTEKKEKLAKEVGYENPDAKGDQE